MGIGEGIETALAASRRFHVPVWAATSATLLECWVPPAGAETILIAGDNDASWTRQAAAFALARRLVREGDVVEVRVPFTKDRDWADEDA
jgi:putative DNA primase/helicase